MLCLAAPITTTLAIEALEDLAHGGHIRSADMSCFPLQLNLLETAKGVFMPTWNSPVAYENPYENREKRARGRLLWSIADVWFSC